MTDLQFNVITKKIDANEEFRRCEALDVFERLTKRLANIQSRLAIIERELKCKKS